MTETWMLSVSPIEALNDRLDVGEVLPRDGTRKRQSHQSSEVNQLVGRSGEHETGVISAAQDRH